MERHWLNFVLTHNYAHRSPNFYGGSKSSTFVRTSDWRRFSFEIKQRVWNSKPMLGAKMIALSHSQIWCRVAPATSENEGLQSCPPPPKNSRKNVLNLPATRATVRIESVSEVRSYRLNLKHDSNTSSTLPMMFTGVKSAKFGLNLRTQSFLRLSWKLKLETKQCI